MRHSKSCSNHVRSGSDASAIGVSQNIRDPGLTESGQAVAEAYGPSLRQELVRYGFNVDRAVVCASELRRAQDTATLVFGRCDRVLPFFKEHGVIPENTPEGRAYSAPDWKAFVRNLAGQVVDGDSVAVVGHGGFLRSLWPGLTGRERDHLNNLDGILLDADIEAGGLRVRSFKEISADRSFDGDDRCGVADMKKIAAIHRMKSATRKRSQRGQRRQRSQRGGATLPLAYVQDGAQMRGTYAEPTGVQGQIGGKKQQGGFPASIMGPFAANGARLFPIAAYLGYKGYTSYSAKTRKNRRSRSRRS